MTDLSRRRVLQTSGGLALAGLAGCTGTDDDENDAETNGSDGNESISEGTDDAASNETDAAQEPYDHGDVHKHGQLVLVLDGESIGLGADEENWKRNGADRHFYFAEGDDRTWHLRSRGVTLEYALNAVPTLAATENSLTYDGTTYEDGDGTSVSYLVNDESVSFEQYTLEHGDDIRVVVETGGSGDPTGDATADDGNASDGGGNESQTDGSF